MRWWVHEFASNGAYIELVSWIFWVLLSITLHELAHGWAAIWQGDRTPIERERMTLNPIVHMGAQSLLIFALCGIAWGLMPVNPHRFRDGHRGAVLVSAAGPAMNVLLALGCVVGLTAWLALAPTDSAAYDDVAVVLFFGSKLNILLAGLNLLPIPPLDGSRILAGISRSARELFAKPEAGIFGMFIFIAIFFMTDVGSLAWDAAIGVTRIATDALGSIIGNPPLREILRV